ncbi:hypothetical protein [Streptomyces sp. NPDC046805]|uniref:hypothetical protein n=1 Tax=Streptomyces sp. NPDC046805 TaxID=3155134 RepID=UPI0033DAFF6F
MVRVSSSAAGTSAPPAFADQALSASCAGLSFADIPEDVLDAAVDCMLDTCAVGVAGSGQDVVRQVAVAGGDG